MGRVLANAGAAADTQIGMAAMPVSIKPPTAPDADTAHQAAGNENYRASPEDGGSSRRIADLARLVIGSAYVADGAQICRFCVGSRWVDTLMHRHPSTTGYFSDHYYGAGF